MSDNDRAGVGLESKRGATRVLVVDDSEDAREVIALILSRAGYEVDERGSAAAAIEAARGASFDLVISDIGMPGASGYQLVKELRSLPAYKTVPILAVTGFAEFADRHTAVWAGFDERLFKPVDPTKLLEIVARLTGAAG